MEKTKFIIKDYIIALSAVMMSVYIIFPKDWIYTVAYLPLMYITGQNIMKAYNETKTRNT